MTRIHHRLQRLERAGVVQGRTISIEDLRFQLAFAADRSRDKQWSKTVRDHIDTVRNFEENLKASKNRTVTEVSPGHRPCQGRLR